MSKPKAPASRRPPAKDNKLPQRWAIIISIAGAVGLLAGGAVGIAGGITAAVLTIGLLHAILD